ncbi:TMEM165/GDT1 family protein [Mesorhizobium sp. M0622]|uniref:COG4280 domain-containing protein n=1 Tax=unclassified Mesorhizobium TaxID=325217 RepID=UPI003336E185
MFTWTTIAPAVSAAFLASLVEVVEAFTIVLAVGVVRGWRPAVIGAGAALALLALLVLTLGPLLDRVPLHALQLVIGVLLLLFGLRWLRKAILRAAGVLALHDEVKAFAEEEAQLREARRSPEAHLGWLAGMTAFKAVVLEGLEVVFIVIAVGAGRGLLLPAAIGALAACVLVLAIGVVIHRPLAQVPENTLKFGVGVMLSAFGVFWTGEGLGIDWPGHDLAILAFVAIFLTVGLLTIKLVARPAVARVS